MTFAQLGRTFGAAAAVAALAAFVVSPASAQSLSKRQGHGHSGTLTHAKVGDYDHRSSRRSGVRSVRVAAPFATVTTRRWHSTAVDAPFASVRIHTRRGVWVRAPFVDLYIPR